MARGENTVNERNTTLGLVRHGDGWGAVVVEDGRLARARSARPCWEDVAFSRVRSTSVGLLHARLASSAGHGEDNAHPFTAEIGGQTWYFSHNGTLYDEPEDGTGATDSERFFRRMAPLLAREDPISAFETATASLSRITALNSLLLSSDGLWAFCVFADSRYQAYYTLCWARTEHGVLVSSEPLSGVAADWIPMENGTALWAPAGTTGDVRVVRLRLPDAVTRATA